MYALNVWVQLYTKCVAYEYTSMFTYDISHREEKFDPCKGLARKFCTNPSGRAGWKMWLESWNFITRWWFQNKKYVHPYLGKITILTNIFQMGWNHQPD